VGRITSVGALQGQRDAYASGAGETIVDGGMTVGLKETEPFFHNVFRFRARDERPGTDGKLVAIKLFAPGDVCDRGATSACFHQRTKCGEGGVVQETNNWSAKFS